MPVAHSHAVALLVVLLSSCGAQSRSTTAGAGATTATSTPRPVSTANSAAPTPLAPVETVTFDGIELGISQSQEAPFPSSQFLVSGSWAGEVDGYAHVLYVGEDAQHSGMGHATLMVYRDGASLVSSHDVALPPGTRALRVVAFRDGKVELLSSDGKSLVYSPSLQRIQAA